MLYTQCFVSTHLTRHSTTESSFKDTQRALEHSRHLESTRALGGHSEGTRVLVHLRHYGTWTLGRYLGTQRAQVGHLGTRTLKVLGHSGT